VPCVRALHAGGILSDNPAVNPELASANHVMLRHCDANSFMSNLDAPVKHQNGRTSYARGHHILRAIVHELVTLHGMVNATLVVLGGSSSGAFGVFGVADEFAGMVRAAQASEGAAPAQVVAVPDGGFWADLSMGTNAGKKIGPMSSPESTSSSQTTIGRFHAPEVTFPTVRLVTSVCCTRSSPRSAA
jgi:hypothetical protein